MARRPARHAPRGAQRVCLTGPPAPPATRWPTGSSPPSTPRCAPATPSRSSRAPSRPVTVRRRSAPRSPAEPASPPRRSAAPTRACGCSTAPTSTPPPRPAPRSSWPRTPRSARRCTSTRVRPAPRRERGPARDRPRPGRDHPPAGHPHPGRHLHLAGPLRRGGHRGCRGDAGPWQPGRALDRPLAAHHPGQDRARAGPRGRGGGWHPGRRARGPRGRRGPGGAAGRDAAARPRPVVGPQRGRPRGAAVGGAVAGPGAGRPRAAGARRRTPCRRAGRRRRGPRRLRAPGPRQRRRPVAPGPGPPRRGRHPAGDHHVPHRPRPLPDDAAAAARRRHPRRPGVGGPGARAQGGPQLAAAAIALRKPRMAARGATRPATRSRRPLAHPRAGSTVRSCRRGRGR